MTYQQICDCLREADIESAEWDAMLLIEHFCNANPTAIRLFPHTRYDSPALAEAVKRRAARYPLQYLLGEWQFFKQTYEVSPDCLIPRSDTEILVAEAIRLLPKDAKFADLCTGSGCIAISVLAERPDTSAIALEKYPATLALAERNAVRNGVRERFSPLLADVLNPDALGEEACFDAILSNPPYIATAVLETLEPEPCREPIAALDGGEDGLLFYRAILTNFAQLLRPSGAFLFEIGFDQAKSVTALACAAGFWDCRVVRDYGGNDRVLICRRAENA